jgi:hypothetical protein
MAAYGPAVNRIKYLITGEYTKSSGNGSQGNAHSPATISGGPDAIYSYRLRIAWTDDGGATWTVLPAESTPTTNRHIRAVGMAMEDLGYVPDGNREPHEYINDGATWRKPA